MNFTLDWFNKWAERLTIRAMRLFNLSERSINQVADSFANRETAFNEADKKIRNRGHIIKWLIMITLIGLFVYIIVKIKNLIK